MNKIFYFLMVGFAFTVMQVTTVEAVHEGGHMATPMCGGVPCPTGGDTDPCGALTGDALMTCVEENPPPSGTSEAGGPPTLTLEDPLCTLAPADRDPGCPAMAGGAGPADHAGMAPALTIGDPLCVVAPALRDPGCPNFGTP